MKYDKNDLIMQTKITEVVPTYYIVLRMQAGKPASVEANRTTKMSAEATARRLAEMHPKREYVVAKVLSLVRALSTEA
jgi:hypothetical protein